MSKKVEKVNGWLVGLLTGWGVKESWAKLLAGAIVGALCAVGVLALDGCRVAYKQTAEAVEFRGSVVGVEGGRK